jgi:hypothetical protein
MSTVPPPPLSHTQPTTPPSAVEAIMPAIEHMRKVLFSPFNWRKWAALAFIALLAGMMGNGGSGGGNVPGDFDGGAIDARVEEAGRQAVEWIQSHLAETILAGVALFLFWLAFVVLMLYISSVFRFIFVDSVISDQIQIRRQWRENRAEGAAFTWWRVGFFFVALLGFAVLVGLPGGVCAFMIVQAIRTSGAGAPIAGAIISGLLAFALFFVWVFATALINAMTRDFVVPIMYLRRIGTMDAWRDFWPILGENKMGFVIYFLMKFVCAMAAGIAALLGALVALIVAAIPIGLLIGMGYGLVVLLHITAWSWWYLVPLVPVGLAVSLALAYWLTCVLLPIPVFFQSYALKYLGSVQPDLRTI